MHHCQLGVWGDLTRWRPATKALKFLIIPFGNTHAGNPSETTRHATHTTANRRLSWDAKKVIPPLFKLHTIDHHGRPPKETTEQASYHGSCSRRFHHGDGRPGTTISQFNSLCQERISQAKEETSITNTGHRFKVVSTHYTY